MTSLMYNFRIDSQQLEVQNHPGPLCRNDQELEVQNHPEPLCRNGQELDVQNRPGPSTFSRISSICGDEESRPPYPTFPCD